MRRANILLVAVAAGALAVGCGGADPQSERQETTATTQAADSVTSFTGHLKTVDVLTGAVTINVNGNDVTLTHNGNTVHVGVVPGPMHQHGVVPGPMRWLWILWNEAIANNEQAIQFLILLDELAFHRGRVTLTTTDGSTIGTVQPVP